VVVEPKDSTLPIPNWPLDKILSHATFKVFMVMMQVMVFWDVIL